ncbi:nucleoside hydrolase [Salibacterium halotolerans]|uniref:Purine nucleosidase n=1 Tax=Salibacterium halotolerans TaxID=1884432 RepID=A0A1I5XP72_9BACI|nr:nucleoside hydrolase [Salibacterium halotolerans]SFQ33751.1 purine nucleosidase [Salibacterium halotolerans]
MPKPIIMDCDPGHDDAIAIFLAAGSAEVDIQAITTVSGNALIEHTTRNALIIAEKAGLGHVPVAEGAGEPLVRHAVTAPHIHGESGLEGPALPEPEKSVDSRHAVDLTAELLLHAEEPITLVPTGPLTNIAWLLKRYPAVKKNIAGIVLMGGGSYGNWSPAAEFNIYADPEAAHIVFESGLPITMAGLDLTHQALAGEEEKELLRGADTNAAAFTAELLEYFAGTYHSLFGFSAAPIHDACAAAFTIDENVFATEHLPVTVETRGIYTTGMTVIDALQTTGKAPNVHVARELNQEVFWKMIRSSLERLP